MKKIILSEKDYRDKVYACWLGKNIGGTLGEKDEGKKEILHYSYYDPMPSESSPNDDLDLQLVWLKMIQERGIYPGLKDFADYWMKHLFPYPFSEYGYCVRNLRRGLLPPISGCFENDFIDQMGSPIRSEIWACIAPADPQLAAVMAWKDAVLDHAGGDGMWGEMFWAAVQSAAFVVDDPMELISIGLGMIPIWTHTSRAVQTAVWCHTNNLSWEEARSSILARFGHEHPSHAPKNIAFTIIGWLYGKDFGDKLCKTVNCGHDTDSTGATIGALLGILGGKEGIPKEWKDPLGERIVLYKFTRNLDAPDTIGELTEQITEIAKRLLNQRSKIADLGERTILAPNIEKVLYANEEARALWTSDLESSTIPLEDNLELTLHYHGNPVIRPGISKLLSFNVERNGQAVPNITLIKTPDDWNVNPGIIKNSFEILSKNPADSNTIYAETAVGREKYNASFVILGPGAAKGWKPTAIVAQCPECLAALEGCICLK